ncbi:MAG: AgmX/PglI C-terminal domain-containing protein [Myxococcales bacterium]|nr:AgmX/PglI C-terminal domain-containing protein [Myxococcales bacterium]
MSNNLPTLTFEVFRGSTPIHRAEFREQSITIGRGASALLPINDPQLSELHAVVNVEDDGSISLLDLGSESGLVYRGQRVSNATLQSGDVFAVGNLQFRLTVAATRPAAPAPVDEVTDEVPSRAAPAPAPVQQRAAPRPAAPRRPVLTPQDAAHDDNDEADELPVEDIMQLILRSGTSSGSVGVNKKRPKVLEVNQIWGNTLMDTKHFSRTMGDHVSIGAAVGWKWHFLGIDMGWIPTPLHMVLPYTPPMWSEVASDWRNDFYAPDENLPGRDHTLFSLNDEEYTAQILDGWDGFAEIGGQRHSFDQLVQAGKARKTGNGFEVPMTDDIRLMVNADGVVFFSHLVHEGQKLLVRNSEDVDYPFMAILSFMTFLGVMFGLIMYFSPKPPENDLSEIPDRFVELLLEKPEIEKKKKKPKANPDAGEGAKAKKKEGKVGKKKAKKDKAKVDVQKKELDRQVAENAGVLQAMKDDMFSNSGLDAKLQGGIGGLIGAKGVALGQGGLGARGSGLGGGGSAEGLGGLGTKGIGSGKSGFGSGGGNFGAKGEGGIGQVGGDPIILGALDRSLIDEVIKRHMNQIKYCYQRELTKNPALGGKVVIKFTIAKDGTVSSASTKTTTMNNSSVEQCIVGRFMRMQFPEPKGGGIVIVSYPFLFSPG